MASRSRLRRNGKAESWDPVYCPPPLPRAGGGGVEVADSERGPDREFLSARRWEQAGEQARRNARHVDVIVQHRLVDTALQAGGQMVRI